MFLMFVLVLLPMLYREYNQKTKRNVGLQLSRRQNHTPDDVPGATTFYSSFVEYSGPIVDELCNWK